MRSLFLVGAKLMGIYYLISVSAALPPIISMLITTATDYNHGGFYEAGSILAVSTIHYSLILGLTIALIVRTEWVANLLRIPDDDGRSPLDRRSATATGLQLIGIYVIISNLPMLVALIIANNGQLPSFPNQVGTFDPLVASISTVLGIGMILGANKLATAMAGFSGMAIDSSA